MRTAIVVPHFGSLANVSACIRQGFSDAGAPSLIVIVDDGTEHWCAIKDLVGELRSEGHNVMALRNSQNLGFAKACNRGALRINSLRWERAPEYLLLLNDDVTMRSARWLSEFERVMDENPTCGAAGCRLLFPGSNSVQHVGVEADSHGMPYHIDFQQPDDNPLNHTIRRLYVTGASMIVRFDLFNELGGFDEGYLNNLEDIDLQMRLVSEGHSILYAGHIWGYHQWAQSPTRWTGVTDSVERFKKKWEIIPMGGLK